MAEADIRATIGLPPDETVEFFRAKGTYPTAARWDDIWQEEHARAFTVAKIMDRQLLERIRASLDDVLANGGTFDQWKERIVPQLQEAGWYGKVEDRDLTGVDYPIFVGRSRLRTIFDTNLRMARAAGQWKRIQALKDVAPYLRYSAVMDRRTRPLHRAWHGTVLPVDHPWWNTHFPPCGWRCRCQPIQLSDDDLREQGWTVSASPQEGAPRRWRRSDGAILEVPQGIDPGFAYNVGQHHMRGLVPPAADGPIGEPHIAVTDLPPLPEPRSRPSDALIDRATPIDDAIELFLERLPGRRAPDGAVLMRDVLGEPLVLDESFFWRGGARAEDGSNSKLDPNRIEAIQLLAEALVDPDEIWWVWELPEKAGQLPMLRRRYLARFEVDGKGVPITIVLDVHASGWKGVTAFRPRNDRYLDNQVRGGALAYRRQ